jgi:hypothetical protein
VGVVLPEIHMETYLAEFKTDEVGSSHFQKVSEQLLEICYSLGLNISTHQLSKALGEFWH